VFFMAESGAFSRGAHRHYRIYAVIYLAAYQIRIGRFVQPPPVKWRNQSRHRSTDD
jgi:hypothetical protein